MAWLNVLLSILADEYDIIDVDDNIVMMMKSKKYGGRVPEKGFLTKMLDVFIDDDKVRQI